MTKKLTFENGEPVDAQSDDEDEDGDEEDGDDDDS